MLHGIITQGHFDVGDTACLTLCMAHVGRPSCPLLM